ncbi:MAG: glutamine amidotransferase [Myxococcales bacterium]|nr:glutamine amidotransferase [Myxococcales bacterium]
MTATSQPTTVALRHLAFEDLGTLAPLLVGRGHRISYLDVPLGAVETLDPLEPDLLVVLGGPISATDDASYPFLRQERDVLAARVAADRPVIGVCLGAQLTAQVLGARVYPAAAKEIGWAPIALTAAGASSPLASLAEDVPAEGAMVLHWHGDTFDLPAGATRLASTALCPNQAFAYGRATLALQFHVEVAPDAVEAWLVGHAAELSAAGVGVPDLRRATGLYGPSAAARGERCLAAWLDAQGL